MRRTLLLAAVLAALASRAAAQCLPPLLPPDDQPPCLERYPSWTGEAAALGVNALLGGVSAGVMQKFRGGSFSDAFLRGLAGGAVIYGGKRVSSERFGGAGLVGREVAAVGASMVRNAGEGRGVLEQIALPVGPVRLYVQASAPRVRVRVDASTTVWLLWAIHSPDVHFDAGMTLSAGAPVFLTRNQIIVTDGDTTHATGIAEPGILFLADVPVFGREFARRTFEHERIHVIQMDQVFFTMTDPVEDAALARLPYVRRLGDYIDINLSSLLLGLIGARIPRHLDRPWETEAIFFSR
ncbi:MAG TPA: hypothetical protein VMN60_02160 [Longimicrobiales bacterium]|nr:hypothetical protein [Longimicrobiales bacterium]